MVSRRPSGVGRAGRSTLLAWCRRLCFAIAGDTMQKLLLVSILFANVAIPAWAARDRNPRRGLKKALLAMTVFDVVYLAGLLFVYPRL